MTSVPEAVTLNAASAPANTPASVGLGAAIE